MTRPCWLNRSMRDHTATPSCGRRVDGVEGLGRLLVGLLARRAGVERIRPRHRSHRRQLRAHVF